MKNYPAIEQQARAIADEFGGRQVLKPDELHKLGRILDTAQPAVLDMLAVLRVKFVSVMAISRTRGVLSRRTVS